MRNIGKYIGSQVSALAGTGVRAVRAAPFLAMGVLLAGASASVAEDFPTRSVRFIIPFQAGQGVDLLGRIPAEAASKHLPQPIVIEYRPGGQGAVGMLELITSKADGYTIGLCASTCYILPQLANPAPFKTDGFKPITTLVRTPFVLVARPTLEAPDLKHVIEKVKAEPAAISVGLPGVGSVLSIMNYVLQEAAQVKFHTVPYSASLEALTDVVAGRLDLVFVTTGQAKEFIEAGKVKALAVTGAERNEHLPNVPTFGELGVSGMEATSSYQAVAPADTPDAVMKTLNTAFVTALKEPALIERLKQLSITPVGDSVEEARAVADTEIARYGQVIRDNNIKPAAK